MPEPTTVMGIITWVGVIVFVGAPLTITSWIGLADYLRARPRLLRRASRPDPGGQHNTAIRAGRARPF